MSGLAVAAVLEVVGRGDRYARRYRSQPVEAFGQQRRTRDWRLAALSHPAQWPIAVGLLRLRARIDAELSGQRLAALAEAVGEDLFDAICAVDVPAAGPSRSSVPLTPQLARANGQAVIESAQGNPRGSDADLLDVAATVLLASS